MTYSVTARRRKKAWILLATVDAKELRLTCKRLDQAAPLCRKAIAKHLRVDEATVRVELQIELASDLQAQIERTREALREAAEARAHAALLGHGTAAVLAKQGMGRRDISVLIGVSPGKASRLLDQYKGGSND